MKFYKYLLLFVLQYFSTSMVSISQPLIILEYSSQNIDQEALKNNSINEDFSTHHKVKKNETLSKIIHKYYGNKGLNLTFVQSAILYKNKSAFVLCIHPLRRNGFTLANCGSRGKKVKNVRKNAPKNA